MDLLFGWLELFLECGEFGEFFCLLFCLNNFNFVGLSWLFICGIKFFCGLNRVFLLNKWGFMLFFNECDFIEFGERGL